MVQILIHLKLKNNNFTLSKFLKNYIIKYILLLVEGGLNLTQNFLNNKAFNEVFSF